MQRSCKTHRLSLRSDVEVHNGVQRQLRRGAGQARGRYRQQVGALRRLGHPQLGEAVTQRRRQVALPRTCPRGTHAHACTALCCSLIVTLHYLTCRSHMHQAVRLYRQAECSMRQHIDLLDRKVPRRQTKCRAET